MKAEIIVIKCNHLGEEMTRWHAKVLEESATHVVVEAHFPLSGHFMGEVPLNKGDRFVETYFPNRWYNFFEIHDRDTDQIKLWYCNVAYPAELNEDSITFCDLALDLVVYPDGRQTIMDEDEFQALQLSDELQQKSLAALAELQEIYTAKYKSGTTP